VSNFFSDFAGGLSGEGPGTDTVSGYEGLGTVGRMTQDSIRNLMSSDPGNVALGGGIFAPNYQALPQADIESRVGRVRGAYQEQFNPFLSQLQQGIDADLSKAGLLTSSRSAALRSRTLGQLAVQSYLPTAELQNALEEQNRQETWNRRMQMLGIGGSNSIPNTIEVGKPSTFGQNLGGLAGRAAGAYLTGGLSELFGGTDLRNQSISSSNDLALRAGRSVM